MATLLDDIEKFLVRHSMSQYRFGVAALNDKHFISDLRNGRDIRASTAMKVRSFMDTFDLDVAA